MKERGLSASNIAFGQGGGLLQQLDRDTLKFAMKASAIQVGGHWRDVYKDPVTDKGKQSKRGQLMLISNNGNYRTVRRTEASTGKRELHTVFKDGKILRTTDFKSIRARANEGL